MMGLVQYDGKNSQVTLFPEPTSWAYIRGEDGKLLIGRGEAWCRDEDEFDPEVGKLIATARAMEDLSQQIMELAEKQVMTKEAAAKKRRARIREMIAIAKKEQKQRKAGQATE